MWFTISLFVAQCFFGCLGASSVAHLVHLVQPPTSDGTAITEHKPAGNQSQQLSLLLPIQQRETRRWSKHREWNNAPSRSILCPRWDGVARQEAFTTYGCHSTLAHTSGDDGPGKRIPVRQRQCTDRIAAAPRDLSLCCSALVAVWRAGQHPVDPRRGLRIWNQPQLPRRKIAVSGSPGACQAPRNAQGAVTEMSPYSSICLVSLALVPLRRAVAGVIKPSCPLPGEARNQGVSMSGSRYGYYVWIR